MDSPVMEIPRDVREFLEVIHGNTEGWIEIRLIKGRNEYKARYFIHTSQKLNWEEVCEYVDQQLNIYYSPCPRKTDGSGTRDDVLCITALFADLDRKDFDGDKSSILPWIRTALPPELQPSIIVDTGNGFHLYWLLKEPYYFGSQEDIDKIEGYLYGLARHLNGDHTFDISRVLRLPGTVNIKDPTTPLPCKIIEFHPDRRFNPESFEEYWEEVPRVSEATLVSINDELPRRFLDLLENSTKLSEAWDGRWPDPNNEKRSGHDAHLTTLLVLNGFSDDEIATILWHFKYGKARSQPNPENYISLTIANVRGYFRKELEEKYQKAKETVIKEFSESTWELTDLCLTVVTSLFLKDTSNPIGLVIEGSPSSEKTTVLSFFYGFDRLIYKSDNFTPKAFLSHAANVPKEQLNQIDLLPRIKHKVLLIPEMAPLFGKRQEDLLENISILTRVFDGEGLETDSGIRGRRSLRGDYLFAMIGATTPIDYKVWKLMGKLGSRWCFYSMHDGNGNNIVNEIMRDCKDRLPYGERVKLCREAVHALLESLLSYYGGVRRVGWDNNQDDDELVRAIAEISVLVATARSIVSVWREKYESGEEEYNYNTPIVEKPKRLMNILYTITKAHALLQGRRAINEDDVQLIVQLGLSSMPQDRRNVMQLLFEEGNVTVSMVGDSLNVSRNTAKAIMKTLDILGLVELDTMPEYTIRLKKKFSWFLGEEFECLSKK